ncbi:MAG TPA: serine hydrolase [Roseiarcus sp.]|nr:serine hydrolase [Roseiarcus sp.]
MAFKVSTTGAGRILRILAGLSIAASALIAISIPGQAREWRSPTAIRQAAYHRLAAHYVRRRWAYRTPAYGASAYAPPFSAMVVDANTGRTLYAVAENDLRHPASITKVMTLYLLFEQLDKGRLTLETPIPMSEHAASQAPSKLGLAPGESLSVESAIKAIVTRSANDVAVAVAEKIGGDEEAFAEIMTRKAHALGMSRTVYRNASGLPDDAQVTSAHDLTILARAIQERFPRYFHYFSTRSFEFAGENIANHNHLVGRVDGVDGIKTGYTRASGFNLMTSMHRDGRSLVAVVMGGTSAESRDRVMEQLLYQHFAQASAGGHSAPMIAEAGAAETTVRVAAAGSARSAPIAFAPLPPEREAELAKAEDQPEGDDEDGADKPVQPTPAPRPHVVEAEPSSAGAAGARSAELAQSQNVATNPAIFGAVGSKDAFAQSPKADAEAADSKPTSTPNDAPAKPIVASSDPAALGWVKGADPVVQTPKTAGAAVMKPAPSAAKADQAAPAPQDSESRPTASEEDRSAGRDGWIVQIAATDDAGKATDMLNRAKSQNPSLLGMAKPFTEKVQKGDSTFYRARFAVLDSAAAEAACRSLKRTGFSCFAMRD